MLLHSGLCLADFSLFYEEQLIQRIASPIARGHDHTTPGMFHSPWEFQPFAANGCVAWINLPFSY